MTGNVLARRCREVAATPQPRACRPRNFRSDGERAIGLHPGNAVAVADSDPQVAHSIARECSPRRPKQSPNESVDSPSSDSDGRTSGRWAKRGLEVPARDLLGRRRSSGDVTAGFAAIGWSAADCCSGSPRLGQHSSCRAPQSPTVVLVRQSGALDPTPECCDAPEEAARTWTTRRTGKANRCLVHGDAAKASARTSRRTSSRTAPVALSSGSSPRMSTT